MGEGKEEEEAATRVEDLDMTIYKECRDKKGREIGPENGNTNFK